ncbi:putative lipoprotein [Acetoanaerobium sticklandii]|uniref:Putative lipoprotein n=1 Tax=Acetoanaerobium sticklandii (strain ATCC 12662 / DSM 519 / JCM 1433 / CCUG 9281 / NCIMB 10654 / HF) TaxID=499177 RepID=E3PUF9_ACESD|nr:MqnA/MqnD/SBP family protein [Acetoanaerobium sticklandii]CBH22397.1 putative lipoprotein [Acetoanaerobium sticklandii]
MKSKKKLISIVASLFLVVSLAGCSQSQPVPEATPEPEPEQVEVQKETMKIAALKGPTGMGMVQLMENDELGESAIDYDISLLESPDDIVGKVISKEIDIAAVPTNLALTLYNKTQREVQLLAVNTLGVVYVLENGQEVNSIADLKGKTMAASGKGATPDFVMQYILKQNAMEQDKDVMVDFTLQHADLAAAMASGDVKLGMLPQPHVTTAMMKNPDLRIALDITAEYKAASGTDSDLPMGCIIVQKGFANEHKELVQQFMDEYKASVDFVNNESEKAATLMEKHKILPNAAVALKAIPYSNIVYIEGMDAKDSLTSYYQILFDFEPKSIGGKLADDGFYYQN